MCQQYRLVAECLVLFIVGSVSRTTCAELVLPFDLCSRADKHHNRPLDTKWQLHTEEFSPMIYR